MGSGAIGKTLRHCSRVIGPASKTSTSCWQWEKRDKETGSLAKMVHSPQVRKGRLVPNWCKLENMLTHFPRAVPEIPVSNVEKAAEYYVNVLGFHFDWGNDQGGIGGISQGECRMFLTNAPFRHEYGNDGAIMVWLNLDSKQAVDELYHRWREAGTKIL